MCWFWWSGTAGAELCQAGAQQRVSLRCPPLSSQDSARAGMASQDRPARPWGSSSAHPGTTETHREDAQVLLWLGIRDYLGKGAAGPCPDIPVPLLFGKRDFLSRAASQFIPICTSALPAALGHAAGSGAVPAPGALPVPAAAGAGGRGWMSGWVGTSLTLIKGWFYTDRKLFTITFSLPPPLLSQSVTATSTARRSRAVTGPRAGACAAPVSPGPAVTGASRATAGPTPTVSCATPASTPTTGTWSACASAGPGWPTPQRCCPWARGAPSWAPAWHRHRATCSRHGASSATPLSHSRAWHRRAPRSLPSGEGRVLP